MAPSGPVPTAQTRAAPIGSHASGPVQIKATGGQDTGHQGSVERTAGSAVSGRRRHAGTSAAQAVASGRIHQTAGTANRVAALSGSATVIRPAAHQTAAPIIKGPINARAVKRSPELENWATSVRPEA